MAKFKDFLLTEDIGLGDLGPKMDRFYHSDYLDAKIGGALSSSPDINTINKLTNSIDLTMPSSEKTGRISFIEFNKNPIKVWISGGTELSIPYDKWRSLETKPEVGKVMTVTFQRRADDRSENASRIDKVIIRD